MLLNILGTRIDASVLLFRTGVGQTTSEQEHVILTTLVMLMQKTLTVGAPERGICSVLFLRTF
jgi:hypothetical protein